jgi:hypothetical protein
MNGRDTASGLGQDLKKKRSDKMEGILHSPVYT